MEELGVIRVSSDLSYNFQLTTRWWVSQDGRAERRLGIGLLGVERQWLCFMDNIVEAGCVCVCGGG